jgi:flagellar L-ring protein precursor FlgH
MRLVISAMVMMQVAAGLALGQSSSLLLSPVRPRMVAPPTSAGEHAAGEGYNPASDSGSIFPTIDPKDETLPMTRAIERMSLYATPAQPPRKFKVEDLVTIIIRQSKKYEADAQAESKKKWNLMGKLSDWFSVDCDKAGNKIGQEQFVNGKPGFKFDYDNKYKMDGSNEREDKFVTRITAHVIDVKPNGNLVVEATLEEQHDEEIATITLTGICRSVDVTPDNTVLSTQIADMRLVEKNHGSVRDATTRGWVPKMLSFAGGPF